MKECPAAAGGEGEAGRPVGDEMGQESARAWGQQDLDRRGGGGWHIEEPIPSFSSAVAECLREEGETSFRRLQEENGVDQFLYMRPPLPLLSRCAGEPHGVPWSMGLGCNCDPCSCTPILRGGGCWVRQLHQLVDCGRSHTGANIQEFPGADGHTIINL